MKHLILYEQFINEQETTEPIIDFSTTLDDSFTTHVIYPEHPEYSNLKPHFKKLGIAFTDPTRGKDIWIDGEKVEEDSFTADHIKAVEAHEIGHHILNHQPPYDETMEQKADIAGIAILKKAQEFEAVAILALRFRDLYKSNPKDYILKNSAREFLRSYIKNL